MIFRDNEAFIDKDFFVEQINESNQIKLCLVDNNSNDKTLQILNEIKEECSSHISVVEIKRCVSEDAAKRAGARFLFNRYDLKHTGFINVNQILLNGEDLNTVLKNVYINQECIVDFNAKNIAKQEIKQTFFKSIFSVGDYIKKIKESNNYKCLRAKNA